MKKVFIAALLIIGIASYAQNRRERPSRDQIGQMTPEQRSQIQLKKMTLDLDLNTSQQEQIGKILAEQSAKREAMRGVRKAKMEVAKADRFEMRNKMLDEQIEMKNKMKGILSPEQYTKWETLREKNKEKMGERREKRKENKMD
jgi:Spy/CpxP family protein refolding chaperone